MAKQKITSSAPPPIPAPETHVEWTAPTGRKLIPGTTFKVEGIPGKLKFRAYIVPAQGKPYVEAVKGGRIRCVYPERIHTVSNAKGGAA